jgi:RHS repeat-associated protein
MALRLATFLLSITSLAFAQSGLRETATLVPLGIEPPPDVQARIAAAPPCSNPAQEGCRDNISLAAFRIDTWFAAGMSAHFPGAVIRLAIESELAPGVLAPDTPPDLPPAHLRGIPLRSWVDIIGAPELRWQTGANRHLTDWIVAIADPRASVHYDWPDNLKKSDRGCVHCERPKHLQGKTTDVHEIRPTGPWLRIRLDLTAEQLEAAPPFVKDLAARLDHRVRVIPADLTRPSSDSTASSNPPPDGFRMAQVAMLHTREVTFSTTDLAVQAGGTGVALTRVYSSGIAHFGPFGRSFDSPWFARVRELPNGSLELYDGSGRRDVFTRSPSGDAWQAPPGIFLDLRKTAEGYLLLGDGETRMIFDGSGKLKAIMDANTTKSDGSDGNRVRFLYDAAGRLVTVVDPIGRQIRLAYENGLVASVSDFAGRRIEYDYDASGRLVEVAGPDPESPWSEMPRTRYDWDDPSENFETRLYRAGRILREHDGEDRLVWEASYEAARPWAAAAISSGGGTWTLASEGVTVSVQDPIGTKTTYQHDAAGRAIKITDAQGAARTYAFDSESRLLESKEPLGEKIEYSYAATGIRRHQGNIATAVRHPRPGSVEADAGITLKTTLSYDGFGRVTSIVQPDGSTQTILRDARGNPTTIVDAGGIPTTNVFDPRGRLESTSDPRSGTSHFTYGSDGYLRKVTNPAGVTDLETDPRGNVLEMKDGGGRTATFEYNALDQVETERRGTSESRFRYDAAGAAVERRALVGHDESGQPVWQLAQFAIDEVGRLRESTEGGISTSWTYDPAGNTLNVLGPGGPPTTYDYDSLGRISSLAIGSRITSYSYDANGNSASVTDALGRTTTFLHDGFGSSTGTVDGMGITTIDRHDAAGRPVDSRIVKLLPDGGELLLRWTTREYDASGRLVKETRKLFTKPLSIPKEGTDPPGALDVVTRTLYDDEKRTITQIDPLGRETRSEMDDQGRLVRVIDPAGNVLEVTWDASGNRLSETFTEAGETDLPPSRVVYQYDNQNRLIGVTDASEPHHPISTRYAYDLRGNVVTATDPQRRETRLEYDIRNRRTKIIDPIGGETKLEWDDADRLTALVDAGGNRTEWIWDTEGRLSAERRADGAKWVYTYDALGNRATMTDANGTLTTYHRDALDRLTGLTIVRAAGVLGPDSITYILDDLGRVVATETSEGVETTVDLDSLDRPLREAIRIGNGAERALQRTFDAAGQPVGLSYPSGLPIGRTFDPLGRIAEIRDAGTALIARYGDAGRRQTLRESGNGVLDRWTWDVNRRLASIESRAPCGIATGCDPLRRTEYRRAPAGAKEEVLRPDLALRKEYRLDALDRITEEARVVWPDGYLARAVRFELDALLNPRAIEVETPESKQRTDTEVNARNQLTRFGSEQLQWDQNGNLRSRQGLALQYDASDRLVKAALSDGTTDDILRDALGRKVRETLTFGGSSRVTDYVHDGPQVIEEYVGGVLAARYVNGRGIDEIVLAERDRDLDGTLEQTLWPLQDELGTVDYLTDGTGAVVARYDYGPYGAPETDPGDWPRLFQGREWSSHLRAYDFRARMLWPDLGRFGQEDPAGLNDHSNPYQALLGNWSASTDPSGESVVLMHGINDSGEAWAARVAQSLIEAWGSKGADPGQDVINLVNRQYTAQRFSGDCKTDIGEFCADNAVAALKHGVLDGDTMRAGVRTRKAFVQLRAKLDSVGSYRFREAIQVIAHSHGTAMLLAAARQNGENGEKFFLKNVIMVGSDLKRTINITKLLESAGTVHNFFSQSDTAVGWAEGAGALGFDQTPPGMVGTYMSGRRPGKLIQTPIRGIHHTGNVEATAEGEVPWMSRKLAMERYASILAIRTPRLRVESQEWVDHYKLLRKGWGLAWTLDLPELYRRVYRPAR